MSVDDVHPDVIDELDAELGAELRAARDAAPLPVLGMALARIFDEGLPPATAPAAGPSARRRAVRRATVLAGVGAFFAGGLGVAGALPAPVQRAVSDAADVVGVQLPHPSDDDDERPGTPADAPVTVPSTVVAPTTPPVAVRPSPTSTIPAPAVAPGRGPARGAAPEKDHDKDKDAEKAPKVDDDEVEEPEVELEQQQHGKGGPPNGRADDDAVPATRGSANGNGRDQDRDEGAVEELLEIVEDPAPGA